MSDLLLELFSEEIPARMQAQAAKDLERLVVGALSDRGLLFEGVKAFAGPRRLTLAVAGLPAKQPDVKEEKKGPRVHAPVKAIDGFLRSAGVKIEDCETRDDGKGPFYVAVIDLKGRATADVIGEFLPEVLGKLPWPKSMRWPQNSNAPVRWVRPLHSILCTLDGEVVDFVFAGIRSGNTTKGHRFLSQGTITAKRYDDYAKKLRDAHVILDAEERKAIIFEGVKQAAFIHGLEMIPDEGLLDEVAGLAEWPVVLIGAIEDQFMDVPPEILQTSMRTNQKYFSLREPKNGKFANRFAVVANMVTEDGGAQIVAGNERVLRARLSDAKFFWDQDRKVKLADRVAALGGIVFHAKLGTQLERVERIEALAGEIAEKIGADVKKAKRAARLAKADLTTGVVGEFPELQGVMGRYYALNDGEDAEVADAVRDHYKPQGPSDAVPTNKVAVAVALADKIDALAAFFSIDEVPTGSGDPFALRRAALGAIRIVLTNQLAVDIAFDGMKSILQLTTKTGKEKLEASVRAVMGIAKGAQTNQLPSLASHILGLGQTAHSREMTADLMAGLSCMTRIRDFVLDRMEALFRVQGKRIDVVQAARMYSIPNELTESGRYRWAAESMVTTLVRKTEALEQFLDSNDGTNLLASYKRASNILKAEEKKDGKPFEGGVEVTLLTEIPERALAVALAEAIPLVASALEKEDFTGAMRQMAGLRAPVDAFFDKVKVNADDKKIRANRLNLLAALRATLHQVADFSKIEG